MTTSELVAMKELLNNGIHLDMKDYVFNGTVSIFGVDVEANIKWSGTIDVDGLGDVAEEVISPMNREMPGNFYSNCFEKKA